MSTRNMWFGTPGFMKQVKVFQPGGNGSPVGYSESSQHISGRKSVRRSMGSHMEYNWTFRGMRDEISHLLDCANGDFGEAPFYFLDPMWMSHNVLPAHWAAPSKGAIDAPPIYGETRPEAAPMAANDGSWPKFGAVFRRQAILQATTLYLPIPPGLEVRFWYAGSANALRLAPQLGEVAGAPLVPTPSDPTISLFDQPPLVISHTPGVDGVSISVNVPTSPGSITIYGMRGVVVPVGSAIQNRPRGFVGGRGHSGVEFDTFPTVTPYSEPYDSIGVTAKLVEVDL